MSPLQVITARAAERKLPVLIAGGHAVIVHGYQRTTFDADLVIRREDRDAWMGLLLDLGFVFFYEGPTFLQFDPPADGRLPVDLMLMNPETFMKLATASIPNPDGADYPRVISLANLVAMKCHALKHGHPGRTVKDADDLIHLFLANRLDPEKAEWRELVLKFGTNELYEKLRRICQAG